MKTHLTAGSLLIAVFLTGCATQQQQPTARAFEVDKSPADTTTKAVVPIRDIMRFDSWKCEARPYGWSCKGTEVFEAPPGWQACKFLYKKYSEGSNGKVAISKEDFYTNDPEDPPRFRAYRVTLTASTGLVEDSSAWIELRQVGLRVIPSSATNKDRFDTGCEP